MSYEDILNHPHHVSSKHPQMSLRNRAAQFAPFAALAGHSAAISETARLTEEEADLDEERILFLNRKIRFLQEHLAERPEVSLTYFQPDEKKTGGAYRTAAGRLKKIDEQKMELILEEGTVIPMRHLLELNTGLPE